MGRSEENIKKTMRAKEKEKGQEECIIEGNQ